MRLGLLEITIIIIAIIAIVIITRISRTNRGTAKQNEVSSVGIHVKSVEGRISKARSFLRRTGLAFILTGVILLMAGISMFRWAFQSYLWSFIIVAIGLVLVFLSRKK
jgi:uncharacterized MAPEG superfamily protein